MGKVLMLKKLVAHNESKLLKRLAMVGGRGHTRAVYLLDSSLGKIDIPYP